MGSEHHQRDPNRHSKNVRHKQAKGKGKEPYLPVIVSARSGEDLLEAPLPYFAGNGEGPSTSRPAVLHVQPKKSRFSLRDMLRLRRPSKKYVPLSSRLSLRSGGSSSTTDIETPPDENTNTTASQPPINRPPAVVWVNPPEPSTDECVSCFEDFSPQEMIKVTCHSYCQECFDRLVRTATQNEQQWPPKCCLNVIPFRTVIRYASNDLHETYRNRSEEWSVPVADRVYCSQRDCNLWIRPARIDRIQHLGRCDANHQTCTICRGPQHIGEECPRDPDVALTNELAREEGWQRCAQCRSIVEHSEACEHMSCRCGYQFCYVCGERWKTCECTIEDLNALKNQVLARRELRQVREAEAESELRDALRQIAEAEERERREEEERLRALALRARWENQRRHEIGVSFHGLRRRLEELHNQQKGLVAYQHRRERYTSLQDASTSTEELAARQKAEMAEFNENKARNRVEWELWLQDNYNRRAQKDKKLEERYLRDLKDFANKRGRTENINEYMQVLRERLDRDARLFRQRQEEWLVRYKNKADEETAIKAELLSNIVRWHEENLAEAKKEQERRQAAELRWVALVMDERARLMDEAENAELDALPEAVARFFGVPVVVDGVAVA
ncbi:IBR domain-containing protein [Colletotrichum musicola]|uniref:RBR-type E3 ubiquitin transferase n=1 Tax=Colletotrichum musicola TaxID=2175873 RepID=A0A8H6MHV3_9PEZI|nr:IBR domain-containing protein [Colletotrichum musicola]